MFFFLNNEYDFYSLKYSLKAPQKEKTKTSKGTLQMMGVQKVGNLPVKPENEVINHFNFKFVLFYFFNFKNEILANFVANGQCTCSVSLH